MFESIRTDRLLLRAARGDDAEPLASRRNDPEVARLQTWSLPYSIEQARTLLDDVDTGGPQPDEWWMLTIADHRDSMVYGDLALRLLWNGRAAEIGYTLGRDHWGNGYATEAAAALVEWLFTSLGITRIGAMLHPENVRSAAVLERIGFRFEGRTKLSYWVGDDNTDDLLYGLTYEDWIAWRDRPTAPVTSIELVELTPDNHRKASRLEVHKSQERLVSPMWASFEDALFPEIIDGAPVRPWMRGVVADGEWAGFVMVAEVTEHHLEPYLWRLLVDRRHQRRGVGRKILDLVVADLRESGASTLLTSWTEGPGSPRPFYLGYGFELTGEIIDGETEGRIRF